MSTRTKRAGLLAAFALCLAALLGMILSGAVGRRAYAAIAGEDAYVRLDSLTASGSEGRAKILEQSGAELGAYLGIHGAGDAGTIGNLDFGKVVVLGTGDSLTLEFDLPDDAASGKVHLMGNKAVKTATVGIYIPGYAENNGYYVLTGGTFCEGGLSVVDYGFAGTSWADETKKTIRIRVWGGTDEAPVQLYSASAAKEIYRFSGSADLGPLSKGFNEHFFYYGGGDAKDVYYDQLGTPNVRPTLKLGLMMCEFWVPKEQTLLTFNFAAMGGNANELFVGIKPAGDSPDGTKGNYTQAASGIALDISAYPVVNDDYIRVQALVNGSGECYLTALTLKGGVPVKTEGYDQLENANAAIPADDTSVYLTAGGEAEDSYLFQPAAGVEGNYNESDASLAADQYGGRTDTALNARKLAAGTMVMYEFDLADSVKQATLKLLLRGEYKVSAHVNKSEKRYGLLPASGLGTGLGTYVYPLGEEDALKSADNKFRICIEAVSDTYLHALEVETAATPVLADNLYLKATSEAELTYLTHSVKPDLYYLDALTPTWFLPAGGSVTFRFNVAQSVDRVNVMLTIAGASGWHLSYDGSNFTAAGNINNAPGGIPATQATAVDTSAHKSFWLRIEGSAQCFVQSVAVGVVGTADNRAEFSTFTGAEAQYVDSLRFENDDQHFGVVGLSGKNLADNGRRLAYSTKGNGEIVYRFSFDASKIAKNGDKNPLYVSLRAAYGAYALTVSYDASFASDKSVGVTGTAADNAYPLLDATDIFTAAPERAGVKTVYVKVGCGATAADSSYTQQECIFTQLGVYADGTKGVVWPNDDEFDYNDPADYDKHPGLPPLPEPPATENGTETFEVPGSSGCGAGASGGLAALLALAAVSLFGIFKR